MHSMQKTQETWVQSTGQEDPLEEEMATHFSIFFFFLPVYYVFYFFIFCSLFLLLLLFFTLRYCIGFAIL